MGQFSTAVFSYESSDRLVNRGVELYNQGDYISAVEKWQQALQQYDKGNNLAEAVIVRENLARVYQELGTTEKAIVEWNFLISYYQQQGNQQKVIRLVLEQAQAYNYLGQSTDAIGILCGNLAPIKVPNITQLQSSKCLSESAIYISQQEKDYQAEAAAWGILGEAYRLQGNYQEALIYLEKSQKIAQIQNLTSYLMASSNSLGNVHSNLAQVGFRRANSAQQAGDLTEAQQLNQEAIAEYKQALNYYQQSLDIALSQENKLAQMNSLLNMIPIYYRQGLDKNEEQFYLKSALSLLPELPETQAKVYATIKLVKLLQPQINTPTDCLELSLHPFATKLLEDGLVLAQNIQNIGAESFILGELGHLAECRFLTTNQEEDYRESLELTQQARWTAEQQLQAPDSLYLWEWQTGRILLAKGKTTEALAAYTRAITTLETIRNDILTANRDLQYDFRDRIEPIYRQLIQLQLEPAISNNKFNSVLNNFEKLKIAELQDYLTNNCDLSVFKPRNIDFKFPNNSNTAFFYSIIFDNSTALIVNFPDGSQKLHWLNLDRLTLSQEINQFRIGLESYFDEQYDTSQAETIYKQLVAPFETQLKQTDTKTLVFIHDGILRTVPMAALHNGNRFLIEEYAIANTPTLSLTPTNIEKPSQPKALAVGLTNSATLADGSQFVSLPNVEQEIGIIKSQISNTKSLLNEEFNLTRLQQELTLNNYSILHIATHGEFSNDPSENFLVTGNEQKITINDLDSIVRNTSPVEFLALTACQTAIGDERSALGLAGVAIQAGVKTALASLWSISDSKTPEIVEQFYRGLQNEKLNKAQALQKAQVNLINQGNHPGFWASFVLIRNAEI